MTTDTSSSPERTDFTNKITKNTDSKLDRIKAKILTLEEKLNNLSEIVTDNEIAIKWVKRGFSLLENAKLQIDKSPEKAMSTLNEIDKIILMIQKITT
ncbi:MAG TPA: hypothetical protein HA319_00135 [Nitrosopumilaceae archaeon]|nr:hypothetical protein [Nitrosopumilaceae archaeon]